MEFLCEHLETMQPSGSTFLDDYGLKASRRRKCIRMHILDPLFTRTQTRMSFSFFSSCLYRCASSRIFKNNREEEGYSSVIVVREMLGTKFHYTILTNRDISRASCRHARIVGPNRQEMIAFPCLRLISSLYRPEGSDANQMRTARSSCHRNASVQYGVSTFLLTRILQVTALSRRPIPRRKTS